MIFHLDNIITKTPFQFSEPINLTMESHENWIVYGKNGSGKSHLLRTIMSAFQLEQGNINYDFSPKQSTRISENILYLTFHDQYSNQTGSLYQLRWNQGLLGELEHEGTGMPRVKDVLTNACNKELEQILEDKLNIKELLDRYIISLSSGEFRKFQIARIILKNPRLLIIENPYIGLDNENRQQVSSFLHAIMQALPIQLILAVCRMPQNTEGYTHLIHVHDGKIEKLPFHKVSNLENTQLAPSIKKNITTLLQQLPTSETPPVNNILKLNDVHIGYNDKDILKHLDWEVHQGEKWALQGRNGAGKSTLLSIICADNPQSYKCDVTLFDHQRGTGESIWDIKRNIGYVSPEIFRSYRKPLPVENMVASGLFDTIGLFKKVKPEDIDRITLWLKIFQLDNIRTRNYMELSDGEQRMVLLARAFVKNPPLLILDEPFHGIDADRRLLAKEIIEQYCNTPSKTLIMVSHYEEDFPPCITQHKNLV